MFLQVVTVIGALSSFCEAATTSIRLRGGATQWDGRVEILYQKEWGTICDVGWEVVDANVTCRQLGYSLAVDVTTTSTYSSGAGNDVRVWVDDVDCEGSESDLGECVGADDWGIVSNACANHTRDAGVICADDPNVLSVRLEGSDSSLTEGRVEILFGNEWGGVCDDGWGMEETAVVCKQLGLTTADNQPAVGEFGDGVSVIWLDDVVCEGDEEQVADCQHSGWGEHNCVPEENIAIRCTSSDSIDCNISISLQPTYLDHMWAGTVEIFNNDEYGRVCADSWDMNDATVACKSLGYHGAIEEFSIVSTPPSSLYWLAGVACSGFESTLCDCPSTNGVANSNCTSGRDAGVVCQTVPGNPFDLRLVGGANEWEGRVEVSVNGDWGTVCSFNVKMKDVDVICRSLGYQESLIWYISATFGSGQGVQWFDKFNCSGTEDNIFNCPCVGCIDQIEAGCTHNFDLSVICQADTYSPDEVVPIRLVGGANQYEGVVEVLYNGRWASVCSDGWDDVASQVTCSQLGYGVAMSYEMTESIASAPVPFWLDDISCDGMETALSLCNHSMWGKHECSATTDAIQIFCSEPIMDPQEIRLVGGPVINSGRVEIFYGGVWGTVCDVGWDIDDAEVTCRQLGYPGVAMLLPSNMTSTEGGVGVVWLEGIDCRGNESRLTECGLSGWGESECGHEQDAGVLCEEMAAVHSLPSSISSHIILLPPHTSPLMLLPLTSPPPPSPPTQQEATPTIVMVTDTMGMLVTTTTQISTQQATPTGDVSESGGNGAPVPTAVIIAAVIIGFFILLATVIISTIFCRVTRLKVGGGLNFGSAASTTNQMTVKPGVGGMFGGSSTNQIQTGGMFGQQNNPSSTGGGGGLFNSSLTTPMKQSVQQPQFNFTPQPSPSGFNFGTAAAGGAPSGPVFGSPGGTLFSAGTPETARPVATARRRRGRRK